MSPRVAAVLAIVAVLSFTAAPATAPQDHLQTALDRYEAGDHAAAVSIDRHLTVGALRAAAENWILAGDPAARSRRERVAAAFSLETVWTATRNTDHILSDLHHSMWRPNAHRPWDVAISDLRSVVPIIAWGCEVISGSNGRHAADSIWYLASVGALQDVRASGALLRDTVRSTPKQTDPLIVRELSTGHLTHARERARDEPLWGLAEAVVHADRALWSISQRPGVLRNHPHLPQALPNVASRFEALSSDPSIGAEARLRLAYVELQRRRWNEALTQILRVRPLVTEPFLVAVAEYFSGWAFEQLARQTEAIAAYRRALEFAPRTRNVSTLLAAQLFLANERVEAYAILDAAFKAEPEPVDLVVQFERGNARLVPSYFARLHEALR